MLNPDLQYIREDCRLLNIDTKRGRISPDNDGYVVTLDAPLFPLSSVIDAPEQVRCENAAQAEYELLTGCSRLQLAERVKLRMGRTFGWSTSDINKRPISDAELSGYLADIAHTAEVKRLTRELAKVVDSNAAASAASAGAAELADRYGVKPGKPPAKPAQAAPLPSAKPTKAPSRGAKA
jgi:hypothetical protein